MPFLSGIPECRESGTVASARWPRRPAKGRRKRVCLGSEDHWLERQKARQPVGRSLDPRWRRAPPDCFISCLLNRHPALKRSSRQWQGQTGGPCRRYRNDFRRRSGERLEGGTGLEGAARLRPRFDLRRYSDIPGHAGRSTLGGIRGAADYDFSSSSATRKANSRDWLWFRRGSQTV